ncbi:MAG: NAD(P)H-binding protein [Streptosporangiaceae bacterium]
MIIVTGANGQLGRVVTERLLERIPAGQIGVSLRDPERTGGLEERGVRVRQGDFTDPAGLAHAFEGASKVLVVSTDSSGEEAVKHHRTAIKAAAAAGATRILYTSHMGSNPSSPFRPMADHAATEAALQDCGVPFTALRNGFYASTVAMLLGAALSTGELVAPEDGPVAWTARADLAEAAALALNEDGLDRLTPALTGSEAIDMAGAATIAMRLTGRSIRRVVVSDTGPTFFSACSPRAGRAISRPPTLRSPACSAGPR